jgi:hypothetical protein
VRLLPTIADAVATQGAVPPGLVLAVAAYCAYDHEADGCEVEPVRTAIAEVPGLAAAIDVAIQDLEAKGPLEAMKRVLDS